MAENLCNIYDDGRMPNPKSMEIEAKLTMMAEDLNDIYSDGGTLHVNFLDSRMQIWSSSNCVAPKCAKPFQSH